MRVLDVTQGSPEWIAARSKYFTASDAPAMMGFSPYCSRADLVRNKALGIVPEVDEYKQRLFDSGHEIEEFARTIVQETVFGEELYPVTAVSDDDRFLASLDGTTMDESATWECKKSNEKLRAAVALSEVPDSHWPQLEHQCIVTGARHVIFTISDGTEAGTVSIPYVSMPDRRVAIRQGWTQFEKDVAEYQHVEDAPRVTGTVIEALPSLSVRVRGEVIESNLEVYRERALAYVEGINTELTTDQHFADAAVDIKFCETGEATLKLTKEQILGQTKTIDEAFRVIDQVSASLRAKRLTIEKLVESRKAAIRAEILRDGQDKFAAHLVSLEKRVGHPVVLPSGPDFAGVMRNKRTLSSLRDAVATELSRAKIAANEVADGISFNVGTLSDLSRPDEAHLFPDLGALVLKAPDDFRAVVGQRVAAHRVKEEARIASERERIRQEEVARIEREAGASAPVPVATASPVVAPAVVKPQPTRIGTFSNGERVGPAPVAVSERWTYIVIDDGLIPREYLMPNEKMIAEAIADGVIIPGIKAQEIAA